MGSSKENNLEVAKAFLADPLSFDIGKALNESPVDDSLDLMKRLEIPVPNNFLERAEFYKDLRAIVYRLEALGLTDFKLPLSTEIILTERGRELFLATDSLLKIASSILPVESQG